MKLLLRIINIATLVSTNVALAQLETAFPPIDGAANTLLANSFYCMRDISNDGINDILVGIPGIPRSTGEAKILSGADGTTVAGPFVESGVDQFGFTVAGLSSLDSDTIEDFATGVPFPPAVFCPDVGYVRIDYSDTGSPSNFLCAPTGTTGNSNDFGRVILGLFDDIGGPGGGPVNGVDDLVVSDPLYDTASPNLQEAGGVFVFDGQGGQASLEVYGTSASDRFGTAVAVLSNQDGDGRRDLVVGAPGANGDSGQIEIISTDLARSDPRIFTIPGTGAFGQTLANIGDLDQDGDEDFIVGAPKSTVTGADAGQVVIFSSAPNSGGEPVATDYRELCRIDGVPGDLLGSSVSGLGDVNGDGQLEFAVGAPGHDSNRGRVYIFSYHSSIPGSEIPDANGDDDDDDSDTPDVSTGNCMLAYVIGGTVADERLGENLPTGRPIEAGKALCDLNNDNLADIGIGVARNSDQDPDSGRLIFLLGATSPDQIELTSSLKEGVFEARASINKEPNPSCNIGLFARITQTNLTGGAGPIELVDRLLSADTTANFRVTGLPNVKLDNRGKPFTIHVAAGSICNGVISASTIEPQSLKGCGVPGASKVSPEAFLERLQSKLLAAENAVLSVSNSPKCNVQATERQRKRCRRKLRKKIKNLRTKRNCRSKEGKRRARCKRRVRAKIERILGL